MKHITLLSLLVTAIHANAALYDRGNGIIYDSTQNITWLQDMNYAGTTAYSTTRGNCCGGLGGPPGAMTWEQATAWASSLSYDGLSGWRLPSANLIGTPFGSNDGSYDGSTDASYNNTRSELGHLFYVDLNNKGAFDTLGNRTGTGYGLTNTSFTDAATGTTKYFLNMQNDVYWEAEELAAAPSAAWDYNLFFGTQDHCCQKSQYFYAVAVHDGDIAAVPVPATAWLFGSGLVGLVGSVRRRKLLEASQ